MQTTSEIADRVIALQDLTASSGTITNRAQGMLLQPLAHDDLIAVAVEIRNRRRLQAILSGQAVSNVDAK
jgi:hypothetical protein